MSKITQRDFDELSRILIPSGSVTATVTHSSISQMTTGNERFIVQTWFNECLRRCEISESDSVSMIVVRGGEPGAWLADSSLSVVHEVYSDVGEKWDAIMMVAGGGEAA